MAFKNTNILRRPGIKKKCFNIVTTELDNTVPKSMPNSPTDYIVLGLGEPEKYYSLSAEQYCEDQRLLAKHSICEVLFRVCLPSLAGMKSAFLTATHEVLL